ncbi:hypothetical protein ACOZ38_25510 [Sphaerisporangium viridialbum]|uniref:hypothetical protein n=1 Tax=Sphaerisporangium viridialbum TaxID=46189 RepID=UPI003C75DC76
MTTATVPSSDTKLLHLIATHAYRQQLCPDGPGLRRLLVDALDGDHDEADRLIAHAGRLAMAAENGEDIR